MAIQTSYTNASFARLCSEATENRETIIIKRRGKKDVALVAADELSSLLETVHLVRSPKNALRLFDRPESRQAKKSRARGLSN